MGWTAWSGKAGEAITIVTQYDVEMFLKIEKQIEKKLEEKPLDQNQVLAYYEKVL